MRGLEAQACQEACLLHKGGADAWQAEDLRFNPQHFQGKSLGYNPGEQLLPISGDTAELDGLSPLTPNKPLSYAPCSLVKLSPGFLDIQQGCCSYKTVWKKQAAQTQTHASFYLCVTCSTQIEMDTSSY